MTNPMRARRRSTRLIAAAAVVGLASSAIVAAGGGSASAAALPQAQSVGRFLDGSLGGNAIQKLADITDARAMAPGTTSAQNPFDVTLLGSLNLPLTNVLNIPTSPPVDVGVVNQVATANLNGASLGASGAVADDGGVNVGDDGDGAPALATINLNGSALGGALTIPAVPGLPALPGIPALPGGTGLDALGGVTGTLGAVSAVVSTKKGGDVVTPNSSIAGVDLSIGSPALGTLLGQVTGLLGGSNGAIPGLSAIPGLGALLGSAGLPAGCALNTSVPTTLDFNNGVTIDAATATIKISVAKLVSTLLGVDISNLKTSNFDLVSFLVKNLPTILSKGLTNVITGITTKLTQQFTACTAALQAIPGIGGLLTTVTNLLTTVQTQLTGAFTGLGDQFGSAASGPLGTLADGLKNLVDIGLNVQSGPGIEPKDTDYPYESNLEATPNQATPVVKNQTLVRAIEVNVLNVSGIPALPVGNSAKITKLTGNGAAQAVRPLALAPGDGAVNLALGNAAAGPSAAAVGPPTSTPPSTTVPTSNVPSTNIPTGVPAGAAGENGGGLPVLPLVALLMLLSVAGGSYWHLRIRGNRL